MVNIQRSSSYGRVEPQANGGRKILPHFMGEQMI